MHILTFANNKGGVAKTTSALSVGQVLAHSGQRVLLIDCDAQSNLSSVFELSNAQKHLSLVLRGDATLNEIALEVGERLFLCQATRELAVEERIMATKADYIFLLAEQLEALRDFDYVLLDTPPSLGPLTNAALAASDAVFIPTQPEKFGFEGLHAVLDMAVALKRRINPRLVVGGVFLTRYTESNATLLHKAVVEQIQNDSRLGPLLMNTSIRTNVKLAEAQIEQMNLLEYAPTSNGAIDYQTLTNEIILRLGDTTK